MWQVFDKTRLSISKNLHSWNFLRSKNIVSCTIMVNSFRKRLSLSSKSGGILKSCSEEIRFALLRNGSNGEDLHWFSCHCTATGCLHTSLIFRSFIFLLSSSAVHETQTTLEVTHCKISFDKLLKALLNGTSSMFVVGLR